MILFKSLRSNILRRILFSKDVTGNYIRFKGTIHESSEVRVLCSSECDEPHILYVISYMINNLWYITHD